jgi:hypothetical protein
MIVFSSTFCCKHRQIIVRKIGIRGRCSLTKKLTEPGQCLQSVRYGQQDINSSSRSAGNSDQFGEIMAAA